jgi:hypothetical protein
MSLIHSVLGFFILCSALFLFFDVSERLVKLEIRSLEYRSLKTWLISWKVGLFVLILFILRAYL